MKVPTKKSKIYVKFRNGSKIVETYAEDHKERKDLFELIKEEVFGKSNKDNKTIGFSPQEDEK